MIYIAMYTTPASIYFAAFSTYELAKFWLEDSTEYPITWVDNSHGHIDEQLGYFDCEIKNLVIDGAIVFSEEPNED